MVVGEVLGLHYYHHNTLNTLFVENSAPGDPPMGSCVHKCQEWLKRCNSDSNVDAFAVLGGVLMNFMEIEPEESDIRYSDWKSQTARINKILSNHGLTYNTGGKIKGSAITFAAKDLDTLIQERNIIGIQNEFDRANSLVASDPQTSLTSACTLIEAFCKVYIHENNLQSPKKENIKDLWKIVSKELRMTPDAKLNNDLNKIISGVLSIIDGIGSFRTHGSVAHSQGPNRYKIKPRHARFAVNIANSLALFLFEVWDNNRKKIK
jgi:hypothetical protein